MYGLSCECVKFDLEWPWKVKWRSSTNKTEHFQFYPQHCYSDCFDTWETCHLNRFMPTVHTRWRCIHFCGFYERFCHFFRKIFKNLILNHSDLEMLSAQHFSNSQVQLSTDCSHSPLVHHWNVIIFPRRTTFHRLGTSACIMVKVTFSQVIPYIYIIKKWNGKNSSNMNKMYLWWTGTKNLETKLQGGVRNGRRK